MFNLRGNTTRTLSPNISIELDDNGLTLKTQPYMRFDTTEIAAHILDPLAWAQQQLVDLANRAARERDTATQQLDLANARLRELRQHNPGLVQE